MLAQVPALLEEEEAEDKDPLECGLALAPALEEAAKEEAAQGRDGSARGRAPAQALALVQVRAPLARAPAQVLEEVEEEEAEVWELVEEEEEVAEAPALPSSEGSS